MRAAIVLAPSLVLAGLVVAGPQPAGAAPAIVGTRHTIAECDDASLLIGGDGKVYGVGSADFGVITGSSRSTLAPLTGLPKGIRAVSVACSQGSTSLVLGSNGVVYGAGSNFNDPLTSTLGSTISTLTPLPGLPSGVHATQISEGTYFTLILGSDGKVYGVGQNNNDQLGAVGNPVTSLTALAGLGKVKAVAIAAGDSSTLVLGANGEVYGAGDNTYGQLSGTPGTDIPLTAFTSLPFGTRIVGIADGAINVVLLGANGRAYAYGANLAGEFGGGSTDSNPHPGPVLLPVDHVVGVASSDGNIGLLQADGTVVAAGSNQEGELATSANPVPTFDPLTTSVPSTGVATELTIGSIDTLIRDSHGIAYGAGANMQSQLTGTATAKVFTLGPLAGQVVGNVIKPTITGTLKVGKTLTAHPGFWVVAASSYSYQWLRNGKPIAHSAKDKYRLVKADKGKKISVRVRGTRTGFGSASATSAAKGPVKK